MSFEFGLSGTGTAMLMLSFFGFVGLVFELFGGGNSSAGGEGEEPTTEASGGIKITITSPFVSFTLFCSGSGVECAGGSIFQVFAGDEVVCTGNLQDEGPDQRCECNDGESNCASDMTGFLWDDSGNLLCQGPLDNCFDVNPLN